MKHASLPRTHLLPRFAALVAFALLGLLGAGCTDQHAAADERARKRSMPEALAEPRGPRPVEVPVAPKGDVPGARSLEPATSIAVGLTADAIASDGGAAQTNGTLRFVEEPGGVRLEVELRRAPPGRYAITLDGATDCFAPPAEASAPNPRPDVAAGRLEVDAKGNAEASFFLPGTNLAAKADESSLVGRCVTVRDIDSTNGDPAKVGTRIGSAAITRTPE